MIGAKTAVVIDTNVAVVANGEAEQARVECQRTCIAKLVEVMSGCRILLDNRGLMLAEYRKNLRQSGQPGTGDAFFKWLHDNQANVRYCLKIAVAMHGGRGFEEFPDDPALAGFDVDDRKFVAVSLASGLSPVLFNASDTDWWQFRDELALHGVLVFFLCPELMSA